MIGEIIGWGFVLFAVGFSGGYLIAVFKKAASFV